MDDPSLSHSRPRFRLLLRHLEPLSPPDPLHYRQADLPNPPAAPARGSCGNRTCRTAWPVRSRPPSGIARRRYPRALYVASSDAAQSLNRHAARRCREHGEPDQCRCGGERDSKTDLRRLRPDLRSATSFFSRVFSASRSFSRRAWSTRRPPYSLRHRYCRHSRPTVELTANVNITTAKINAARFQRRQIGPTAGDCAFPEPQCSRTARRTAGHLNDQNGNYQPPAYQLPKETRCWRAGASRVPDEVTGYGAARAAMRCGNDRRV